MADRELGKNIRKRSDNNAGHQLDELEASVKKASKKKASKKNNR